MQRGCISMGEVCRCVACALEKGYAYYGEDKRERTLIFLPNTEY